MSDNFSVRDGRIQHNHTNTVIKQILK